MVGLLFGGLLPYLFGAMGVTCSRAVPPVRIVEEIRHRFRENPGIMQGTDKPDHAEAVDLRTRAAIKEPIIPSLLPVLSPIVVYFPDPTTSSRAALRPASRRRSPPSAPCCSA